MELSITGKKENQLLKRTEVEFNLIHTNEKTPKRGEVRNEIATELKAKKETVIIDHMNSLFGKSETNGTARIYKTVEDIKEIEADYMLKRHGLYEEKKKAEKKE